MHDPLVLICSIKMPWLRRYKPKMYLGRHGRRLGPIALVFVMVIDIWHREPDDHDSLSVCRSRIKVDEYRASWRLRLNPFVKVRPGYSDTWVLDQRWKYHVHHWHLRVWPVFRLRRWLFVRCAECGRRLHRGEAPIGTWGGGQLWHPRCHDLVYTRRQLNADRESYVRFIRRVQGYLDWTDEDVLADAYQRRSKPDGYGIADQFTLARLLGWEFDHDGAIRDADSYVLLHKPTGRSTQPHDHPAPSIPRSRTAHPSARGQCVTFAQCVQHAHRIDQLTAELADLRSEGGH